MATPCRALLAPAAPAAPGTATATLHSLLYPLNLNPLGFGRIVMCHSFLSPFSPSPCKTPGHPLVLFHVFTCQLSMPLTAFPFSFLLLRLLCPFCFSFCPLHFLSTPSLPAPGISWFCSVHALLRALLAYTGTRLMCGKHWLVGAGTLPSCLTPL